MLLFCVAFYLAIFLLFPTPSPSLVQPIQPQPSRVLRARSDSVAGDEATHAAAVLPSPCRLAPVLPIVVCTVPDDASAPVDAAVPAMAAAATPTPLNKSAIGAIPCAESMPATAPNRRISHRRQRAVDLRILTSSSVMLLDYSPSGSRTPSPVLSPATSPRRTSPDLVVCDALVTPVDFVFADSMGQSSCANAVATTTADLSLDRIPATVHAATQYVAAPMPAKPMLSPSAFIHRPLTNPAAVTHYGCYGSTLSSSSSSSSSSSPSLRLDRVAAANRVRQRMVAALTP